jgi:hypothetical protein
MASRRNFPSLFLGFSNFRRGLDAVNKTIWPTIFALRRLRLAVRATRDADAALLGPEIALRIAEGAEVPLQLDLTRFEDDFAIDDQEAVVGELALFELTALFEGALESACQGKPVSHKKLMFPPPLAPWLDLSRLRELDDSWGRLRLGGSQLIADSFGQRYRLNPHYSIERLPHLEVAFRYWKEVRNCLIHAGGRANRTFVRAQFEYLAVKRTDTGLGKKVMLSRSGDVSGNPSPAKVLDVGDRLLVSPYGAFNAGEVMLKLATTLDFLIARTPEGEADVISRLNAAVNAKRWHDPQYRQARVVGALVRDSNMPTPAVREPLLVAIAKLRGSS